MSYESENGYIPETIEQIISYIRLGINAQFGTTYTEEEFLGTNYYKYVYANAQRMQRNEIKTSEIFQKIKEYITIKNLSIQRPVATYPGIIEAFSREGYVASIKPIEVGDAGKIFLCVDVVPGDRASGTATITSYAALVSGTDDTITVGSIGFVAQTGPASPGSATFQAATSNSVTAQSLADQINAHASTKDIVRAIAINAVVTITAKYGGTAGNAIVLTYTESDGNAGATVSGSGTLAGGTADGDYDEKKLEICTLIKDSVALGMITQGSESETIVLSNGQSFDFKYALPDRIETKLKLTLTTSDNNQLLIGNPDDVKELLLANINAKYSLGKDFEPQRYFTIVDAPWCSTVVLEYSIDGGDTYLTAVYDAEFDELLETSLANITLVEV
jgi:hypothetical protein